MNRHFLCIFISLIFLVSHVFAQSSELKQQGAVKKLIASEMTAASIDRIVSKVTGAVGSGISVQVIDSPHIFSRVFPGIGEIRISRTLLNSVYESSGSKGVAFLLGHEMGHMKVDSSFKGATAEFEADRIGFDTARKVYPDLDGTTVKKVFATFDKAGSKDLFSNMLNKLRGAVNPSHPTDIARLDYLASHHKYSAKLGFDKVAGRGGFIASPDSPVNAESTTKIASTSTGGVNALSRGVASVKSDFLKGGLLVDVAVSAGFSIFNSMSSGGSLGEGFKNAGKYLGSSTFIVGDLMGGAVGAALGAMIPLPASFVATGLLGQSIATFPAIAGAMLGAQLGIAAIELIKDGNFSIEALFASVKVFDTVFRAVGASIGMAVGSLIPIPFVGTIIGGICGTIVADKILSLFKGPSIDAVDERAEDKSLTTLSSDTAIVSSEQEELPLVDDKGRPVVAAHYKSQMEKHYADFVRYNKSEELNLAVESLLKYRKCKAAFEKLAISEEVK